MDKELIKEVIGDFENDNLVDAKDKFEKGFKNDLNQYFKKETGISSDIYEVNNVSEEMMVKIGMTVMKDDSMGKVKMISDDKSMVTIEWEDGKKMKVPMSKLKMAMEKDDYDLMMS